MNAGVYGVPGQQKEGSNFGQQRKVSSCEEFWIYPVSTVHLGFGKGYFGCILGLFGGFKAVPGCWSGNVVRIGNLPCCETVLFFIAKLLSIH